MTSPVDTLKALVVEMRETERELRVEDRSVGIWPDNDTADIVKEWRERTDAAIAALSGGEAVAWRAVPTNGRRSPQTRWIEMPVSQWAKDDASAGVCTIEYAYTTPRIPDGIDGQVIALLVAGGFVSQAKVDEARNIAISATPGDEGRGEQRAKPFDYRKHYPPMQPDCNGRATTGQTPEDWIERAARCAEEILQCELADIPAREESKSIEHLAWMAMKLAAKDVGSATKTCRWLGYLQGALVTFGYSTLETEKKRNLRSVAPPAAPREE